MRHVSLPRKVWLTFNMLVFTDPVSDWELQWPCLASDWLSVIMGHNTVSSLVICNPTQPSDWLMPDWPQIVTNCTEQVSPQPWADTIHWSMLLTSVEDLLMLTLSRILIIHLLDPDLYLLMTQVYKPGFEGHFKNLKMRYFLMTLHKVTPKTWFVIFQTMFVIRVLKVSTLISIPVIMEALHGLILALQHLW